MGMRQRKSFTLFNLGCIVLFTPVGVSDATRTLDFPFALGAAVLVAVLLARGGVTRRAGGLLLTLEGVFVVLQLVAAGKL